MISDIDGTITKSDLLGHLLPRVGFDWSHRGVTRLFTNIKANGYIFMFLSSRAIAQASATRDYLHTLNQDGETLPAGPVIISPDGLFPSLYRELVSYPPILQGHQASTEHAFGTITHAVCLSMSHEVMCRSC